MAKDLITVIRNGMTPAQFDDLAEVPPEIEWLANLTNPKTRRAYKNDVEEFVRFTGLRGIGELRDITRAHVMELYSRDKITNSRSLIFAPIA